MAVLAVFTPRVPPSQPDPFGETLLKPPSDLWRAIIADEVRAVIDAEVSDDDKVMGLLLIVKREKDNGFNEGQLLALSEVGK